MSVSRPGAGIVLMHCGRVNALASESFSVSPMKGWARWVMQVRWHRASLARKNPPKQQRVARTRPYGCRGGANRFPALICAAWLYANAKMAMKLNGSGLCGKACQAH